jgi:hypothetical protein
VGRRACLHLRCCRRALSVVQRAGEGRNAPVAGRLRREGFTPLAAGDGNVRSTIRSRFHAVGSSLRLRTQLNISRSFKAEQELAEWQAAVEALLLVVENNGPSMMARIGVMGALNRHVVREFNPGRKDTHWEKRKLKRDE